MKRLGLAVFFTMNVMVFTMTLWAWDVYQPGTSADTLAFYELMRYGSLLFTTPVVLLLGMPLAESVLDSWSRRQITTEGLLLLGVITSFVYSAVSLWLGTPHVYFEVTCLILLAMTFGRWVEAEAKQQATQALQSLRKLLPEFALKVNGSQEERISTDELQVGDLVHILAGERIPLDGTVERHPGSVDEQIVTGESEPRIKHLGDSVYGGTVNLVGDLYVRATVTAADGTIPRMIELVRTASLEKCRDIRLADRLATWFIPFVFVIALGTLIDEVWVWHDPFQKGLMSALSVVLIACPCALGIATPLAVWNAIGVAARHQVLLRSGDALSTLSRIDTICLDKTGTLTCGHELIACKFDRSHSGDHSEVKWIAEAVALRSSHPLAQGLAIGLAHWPTDSLSESSGELSAESQSRLSRGLLRDPMSSDRVPTGFAEVLYTEHVVGQGMIADLSLPLTDGDQRGHFTRRVWLGSLAFAANRHLVLDEGLMLSDQELEQPAVCIGWDGRIRAVFLFQEELRPEARQVLDELKELGMRLVLLTGDHPRRAQSLQRRLQIEVESELLPADKLAALRKYARGRKGVAMVGDGINDAPALAAADVGIALDCGADVSRDAADVCLLGSSLARLPWIIKLARDTRTTILWNLLWACLYNVIGMGLAVVGWLNPIVAALAMVVSSLLVIGNSLRLARRWTENNSQREAKLSHLDFELARVA